MKVVGLGMCLFLQIFGYLFIVDTASVSFNMSLYDRFVLPKPDTDKPVLVYINLALRQIIDLDERNQKLTTKMWMRSRWFDPFFVWNATPPNTWEDIRLKLNTIWHPDIELYNDISDTRLPIENYINAQVTNDGYVWWYYPVTLKSSCLINVKYFPFDQQACPLEFGSWTYDGNMLNMVNYTTEADDSSLMSHGEWDVIGIPIRRYEIFYPCCTAPYPKIKFWIILRRKPLYYLFNLVFPAVFITATTFLVFYLPAASGEKVSLGVTVLLALTVFLLMVAESMPPQSENIPLMAAYFGGTILVLSLCTATTVLILNVYHRGVYQHQVPRWLKVVILDWLAAFLFLSDQMDGIQKTGQFKPKEANHLEKTPVFQIDSTTNQNFEDPLRKIEKMLRMMLKITEEDQQQRTTEKSIETEWMMVAMVIDRLMLIVFFVLAFLMTLVIFVNHPTYDNDYESFVDTLDPELRFQRNYLGEMGDYEQQ